MMMFNELAKQVKRLGNSRTMELRRTRTRNLIIGAGIGSAVGVAAGILFAPKSGKETRHIIADKTGETVKNLKENVTATKDRIFAAAEEKKKEATKETTK